MNGLCSPFNRSPYDLADTEAVKQKLKTTSAEGICFDYAEESPKDLAEKFINTLENISASLSIEDYLSDSNDTTDNLKLFFDERVNSLLIRSSVFRNKLKTTLDNFDFNKIKVYPLAITSAICVFEEYDDKLRKFFLDKKGLPTMTNSFYLNTFRPVKNPANRSNLS